jgi:hypothetical protein
MVVLAAAVAPLEFSPPVAQGCNLQAQVAGLETMGAVAVKLLIHILKAAAAAREAWASLLWVLNLGLAALDKPTALVEHQFITLVAAVAGLLSKVRLRVRVVLAAAVLVQIAETVQAARQILVAAGAGALIVPVSVAAQVGQVLSLFKLQPQTHFRQQQGRQL